MADTSPPPKLKQFGRDCAYFSCRNCGTHIALWQDLIEKDESNWVVICKAATNLLYGDLPRIMRTYDLNRIWSFGRDANCAKCKRQLGDRFIRSSNPRNPYQRGTCFLHAERLMFWNGLEEFDSLTWLPVLPTNTQTSPELSPSQIPSLPPLVQPVPMIERRSS